MVYGDKPVNDLLGAHLLEKYGGLWLSPYTVCLNRDYNPLFNDCKNHEIVTFGTSPNMITNMVPHKNKTYVNNLIIGSKRNCPCIIAYKILLEQHLFGKQYQYMYNHVGKNPEPLSEAIINTKPSQKHYSSKCDGSYNINDRKINKLAEKLPEKINLHSINFERKKFEWKFDTEDEDALEKWVR